MGFPRNFNNINMFCSKIVLTTRHNKFSSSPKMTQKPSQPFGNQSGGQRSRTLTAFRDVVNGKGGSDLVGLVRAYVKQDKSKKYEDIFVSEKYNTLISRIRALVEAAPNIQKRGYLSLLVDLESPKSLRKQGFSTSKETWKKARKHARNVGHGEYYFSHMKRLQSLGGFLFLKSFVHHVTRRQSVSSTLTLSYI